MSTRRFTPGAMAALLCCGLLGGCGYKTGGLYDESISTVAVPIFQNRTFYRGVEFKLTEALIKRIESTTPYKVAREASADTLLTGTIIRVDKRLLSRQIGTGLPQELQIIVVASFEWKNLHTGKIIRKRGRIQGVGDQVPSQPVGEPFEVGQNAAVDQLAVEIVSTLRADW